MLNIFLFQSSIKYLIFRQRCSCLLWCYAPHSACFALNKCRTLRGRLEALIWVLAYGPPRTQNSSQSVSRLIVSALTNKVGKAACPGSDLLMDWKWSESYVTLCWVSNLNWQDVMAGSDSWGWVTNHRFSLYSKGFSFARIGYLVLTV